MKTNIIVVFNQEETKILMCLRLKAPYQGLYNLVGGKLERGERSLDAAYRELVEETEITKKDIELSYVMNFQYYLSEIELQIFVGKLNKEVTVQEEVNKLEWMSLTENFFDTEKFAGDGNIGHILKQIEQYKKQLFPK